MGFISFFSPRTSDEATKMTALTGLDYMLRVIM